MQEENLKIASPIKQTLGVPGITFTLDCFTVQVRRPDCDLVYFV